MTNETYPRVAHEKGRQGWSRLKRKRFSFATLAETSIFMSLLVIISHIPTARSFTQQIGASRPVAFVAELVSRKGNAFNKTRQMSGKDFLSLLHGTSSDEVMIKEEGGSDATSTTAPSKQGVVEALDPDTCSDFMLLVCSSTSCAKKRRMLQMDEYSTFGGLYVRREGAGEGAENIRIEESSCLGSCQMAPCVAVQHEDFMGTVALEGMTPNEFEKRVFHNVVTENDIDRVWDSVENAVRVMMNEEEEDNDDEEDYYKNDGNYV